MILAGYPYILIVISSLLCLVSSERAYYAHDYEDSHDRRNQKIYVQVDNDDKSDLFRKRIRDSYDYIESYQPECFKPRDFYEDFSHTNHKSAVKIGKNPVCSGHLISDVHILTIRSGCDDFSSVEFHNGTHRLRHKVSHRCFETRNDKSIPQDYSDEIVILKLEYPVEFNENVGVGCLTKSIEFPQEVEFGGWRQYNDDIPRIAMLRMCTDDPDGTSICYKFRSGEVCHSK